MPKKVITVRKQDIDLLKDVAQLFETDSEGKLMLRWYSERQIKDKGKKLLILIDRWSK